jgi:glyoxylase-like metal-dependent hydrolase (beta-lactamase superfamily II)
MVMRSWIVALGAVVCIGAAPIPNGYHFIPGQVPENKGPDGNTVVLDAPKGLIVVDTGRHPEHVQAILDYAKQRGRQIVAIVNSHWHMDHTQGNADILAHYPKAEVYTSNAINGALGTFLANGRKGAEERLKDPKTTKAQIAEIERYLDRMEHPQSLKPTRPITASAKMSIGGRLLDVHLAKFAATEGDTWLYDRRTKTAIVGDLVVGIVPFMDTACPDGWAKALKEIQATPFTTLIPGHGDPMNRADFEQWKKAYDNLIACGHSSVDVKQCVTGWQRDAARFIDDAHKAYVPEAAQYYVETRLRSSPEEQQKYCRPLKA